MKKMTGLNSSVRHQRGLTLVELMIGILLSLLILTAVVYVFAGSRASYRHQESSSAVQESGRIALEILGRDIRMAGNPGCGNVSFLQHVGRDPLTAAPLFNNELAVGAVPGAGANVPDGITITRGSAAFALVDSTPAANQIQLDDIAPLGVVAVNDQLLLSDCVFTDVMTVTAVAGSLITGNGLSRQFRPGSQVMRLETVAFTVGAGQLLRNGQAVAGGVTNMKLMYGVSAAAGRSAIRYEAAPDPDALANTVAVKLRLTVADGPEVSQMFTSTIALRNRAP